MQAITEYCGIPVNWKLPRIKPGNEIRFWYWDSPLKTFRGTRGIVIAIRYLSANPLDKTSRKYNEITRGNVLYTLKTSYYGKPYVNSFYNQRMSNVEIVK